MARHPQAAAVAVDSSQDPTDEVTRALAWFDALPAERHAVYDQISNEEGARFEAFVRAGGDPSSYDPSR